MRYWVLNALPVPHRATEIIVPIILAPLLVDMAGTEHPCDPLEEYAYLDLLRRSGGLVAYQEGDLVEMVSVDLVTVQQGEVTAWLDRHPRRGLVAGSRWFGELTVTVRLLRKED